jgi:hypothetical protein
MTEKEKAKELFDKMYLVEDIMGNYPMCFDTARQCAMIAVDEIQNTKGIYVNDVDYDYWEQVKHELITFKSE